MIIIPFCKECGKEYKKDAKFCSSCGVKLAKSKKETKKIYERKTRL